MHLLQRSTLSFSVLLLVASRVTSQGLSSLPGCGQTCVNSMLAESSSLGCTSGNTACMCANPNFKNGINSCASQACAADLVASVTNYAIALCATATSAPTTSATSASTTSTAAASTTTTTGATTTPLTSSTATATSSTTTASSTLPTSTSTTPPTSTTAPATTDTSVSSTDTSTTSTQVAQQTGTTTSETTSSSPTSSTADSVTSSSPSVQPSSTSSSGSGSLSAGAKAGIGVGVAIGAAAAVAGSVYFLLRRRQSRPNKSDGYLKQMNLPEPTPSSSRNLFASTGSFYETRLNDLESRSHRYEDMAPREKPKYIV